MISDGQFQREVQSIVKNRVHIDAAINLVGQVEGDLCARCISVQSGQKHNLAGAMNDRSSEFSILQRMALRLQKSALSEME